MESFADAGAAPGPVADRQLDGEPTADSAAAVAREFEQMPQFRARIVVGVFDPGDDVIDDCLLPGIQHALD